MHCRHVAWIFITVAYFISFLTCKSEPILFTSGSFGVSLAHVCPHISHSNIVQYFYVFNKVIGYQCYCCFIVTPDSAFYVLTIILVNHHNGYP